MDLNSLVAMLGPEAREAVAQFYGRGRPPATDPEDGFGGSPPDGGGGGGTSTPGGDSDVPGRGGYSGPTGGFGIYNNNNNYINPNSYMGDDKEGASRLFADIISAQTQDYLNRFAPIEDYLAGTITQKGTTFLEGDMARTQAAIREGAQSARDQYTRRFERYGIAGRQLDNSLAETSAMVGGMNDTRDRDVDRKIALLGGGLGSIAQKARAQQGGG